MGGFPVEKFRKWYQDQGELYIAQIGVDCGCPSPTQCTICDRDGHVYLNKYNTTVNGQQYTGYGMFHNAENSTRKEEFGLLGTGTVIGSVFPKDCILARPDRVILPQRPSVVARHRVTRGAGAIDGLTYPFLHKIEYVRQGATIYHSFVETTQGIQWYGSERPEEGSEYAIGYVYAPTYVVDGDSIHNSRPEKDGELMPQELVLTCWVGERVNQVEG